MPVSRVRCFIVGVVVTLMLVASAAGAAESVTQDVKVAVLPFQVNAGEDLSYLQDSLPELLTDRLREAGFEVVDPAEINRLIEEKGVSSVSTQSARELALLTGAGFSVFGSLNQIGDDLTLDARLVDTYGTHPGKKMSVTKEGLINLLPAVDELVDRMKMDLLRLDIIAEVEVEGTKVLDKDVVLMRLTLQKGDMLTAKAVNTALKNIYDLGYFDDVEVKVDTIPDGKKVIFVVEEKPRIQALGVKGSDAIDSEDIIEAISTKKGGIVNPKVLADDIRVIREMYRKEGYYKAKVTHEIEEAGTGVARLTFVIDEGPKLYIKNVVIDGAKQLDPDDIKDVLALKERGWLSWISNSGVLKEELLDRDAAAIQAYYTSKGFIDVKVGRPEVEIKDDGIDVIYQVWEGDRYKMGETIFKGDLIDSLEKLKEVTKIDKLKEDDDYFDRSIIKSDVDSLTNYYNDYGYAYVDVQVNLKDDAEKKIVDVVYSISKHQRVHIRRVLIEGNTMTRDNVIMREMRLADGDMFSGDNLNRSHQRLNNLGFFEKVDISPVPTGNPEEMDLIVKVKDKPTGKIGGGIGYSTYDSVYLAAGITESNLFGKGYSLGFNGAFSSTKTAFTANFVNPHINDSDVGFGLEAHNRKEDFSDYDKDSIGSTINFFYPVGEYSTLSWDYTAEYYTIRDISDDAADSVKDDKGSHVLSQISATFTRDTRDRVMRTTTGTVGSASIIFGGGPLQGSDDFVKYLGLFEWYTPVFEEVIFHTKTWAGLVHKNISGSSIPTDQRFQLGGLGSVRGYSRYAITPLDSDNKSEGGNKAFYVNLELTRVLSKEYGIAGLVFLDAGNSWKEGEMFFSSPSRKGTSPTLGLYKGVGLGFNWYSPMGPVGFAYGYGLDKIGTSGRHKFELMMGQQF
ncbi:outer membrane protein assembly factor BamA [uncultured Pseudodesulfovibrio sp.]|uniref:outer membrane protein assembly factor BamA n=1 Tax=uncultured Pseudodesulfovibrio sp. TaxID=2035858 RepID=UPI0029C68FF0|nr:outer membrane protein assembly factor BamA [uncultured Pseudodesulfovibrio sp.]